MGLGTVISVVHNLPTWIKNRLLRDSSIVVGDGFKCELQKHVHRLYVSRKPFLDNA